MAATAGKIVGLRNLLAERFPQSQRPSHNCLQTGIAAFDQAIPGGLPKNCITEVTSPQISAGSACLLHGLLHAAYRDRYFLALIDGRDSFDPQPAGNLCLRNLLWIRCHNAIEGVKAADLLLRDGNFPLVILDLVFNPAEELRKIPQTSWYRLQRLVEKIPTALLVFTRQSLVSSAQWKLTLSHSWTLADLEKRDAVSHLKIDVGRVHGAQQVAGED
jgi:recA bacterial DNA recombination protein